MSSFINIDNIGIRKEWRSCLLCSIHPERLDYLNKEAAVSLYEVLDLLLQVVVIFIDVITRLLHRRKKGKRIKKMARQRSNR